MDGRAEKIKTRAGRDDEKMSVETSSEQHQFSDRHSAAQKHPGSPCGCGQWPGYRNTACSIRTLVRQLV